MSIPFHIPAEFLARVQSRELVRQGALLRDTGTGRIVAHLQETGVLAQMARSGLNPLDAALQGVQVYQNEQIKAGIALLQNLGMANLALTGIGIGVSVTGFAMLAGKLNRIEEGLGNVAAALARVEQSIGGVSDHLVRQELSDLRAELRRIDEAWLPAARDPVEQWRLAADKLLTIEERFLAHARALIAAPSEPHARDLMIDAYAFAAEGRRSALMAAGEDAAAERAAREYSKALNELTSPLGAAQLLREEVAAANPRDLCERADAVERLRPAIEARAAALREREQMAATAPLTIVALRQAGVSGRDWLARATDERDTPLICLPVLVPTALVAA